MDPFITPTVVTIAAGLMLNNSSDSKRYISSATLKPITRSVVYDRPTLAIEVPRIQSDVRVKELVKSETLGGSQKDRLFDQIFSYMPVDPEAVEPDEPTYDHVMVAYEFIRLLPDTIKMPKFMKNDFGGIGFYWELGDYYLDVDIEDDSMLSFFAHDRLEKKDICIEPINVYSIDHSWVAKNFSRLYGHAYSLAA